MSPECQPGPIIEEKYLDVNGTFVWVKRKMGHCIQTPNLNLIQGDHVTTALADVNGDLFPDVIAGVAHQRLHLFLNHYGFNQTSVALGNTNDIAHVLVTDLVSVTSQRRVSTHDLLSHVPHFDL